MDQTVIELGDVGIYAVSFFDKFRVFTGVAAGVSSPVRCSALQTASNFSVSRTYKRFSRFTIRKGSDDIPFQLQRWVLLPHPRKD